MRCCHNLQSKKGTPAEGRTTTTKIDVTASLIRSPLLKAQHPYHRIINIKCLIWKKIPHALANFQKRRYFQLRCSSKRSPKNLTNLTLLIRFSLFLWQNQKEHLQKKNGTLCNAKKRKKMASSDNADMHYINKKNEAFVKRITKKGGEWDEASREIRQNLERGTAL